MVNAKYYGTRTEIDNLEEDKTNIVLIWLKELLNYGNCRMEADRIPDHAGLGRNLARYLQDGVILLKIIEIIKPGTVGKIDEDSFQPFIQLDNIARFTMHCEDIFGIPQYENFLAGDLYAANNVKAVYDGLFKVGTKVRNVSGYNGPHIKV